MKILIGTTSEQKINIVKDVFNKNKGGVCAVIPMQVESGIVEQPLDKETTIKGSVNRAKNAINKGHQDYDIGLGLEGGLVLIDDLLHLICVASVVDKKLNIYTGISKDIPLQSIVSEKIKKGEQFCEAIREYEKFLKNDQNITSALVTELICRKESFTEAIEIALSKYKTEII